MTQAPQTNQDDNKARAFFITALTIGAGFAGLAVAGIVLGFDYLLHGEPHEQDRLAQQRAQRRRDRYTDALAWLENDRLERERARQAKREWFEADPATRGTVPSSNETFGRVGGRIWNNMFVGWRRFKNGWKVGRDEARERRETGARDWWRRPDEPEQADPRPAERPGPQQRPSPEPEPRPQQVSPDPDDIIDAEIIPDPEPTTREVVPVGQDDPRRPDETVDEYRRRLADLENEVQQNHNGRRPDPAIN